MNRIRLRRTHPNLYSSLMVYGLLNIALALNFIFLTPAFDPLGINKYIFGVIFIVMGAVKILALNIAAPPRFLRFTVAANVSLFLFFGGILVAGFFSEGQTSLQLPLTYFGLAFIEYPLLKEPLVNPVTETVSNGNH